MENVAEKLITELHLVPDLLRQPVIFFGHGSPMNAIEDNEFSNSWKNMGSSVQPQAILVISAHWETSETLVHAGLANKTIHDFYGFPQKLFQIQYPAPANPALAQRINAHNSLVKLNDEWGLDHGAWSVLVHAFPKADIPVIQLSLNKNLNFK